MRRDDVDIVRRVIRVLLLAFVLVVLSVVLIIAAGAWYLHPPFERVDDIVYGRRNGKDLTFDIFRPEDRNGLGVLLIVSN